MQIHVSLLIVSQIVYSWCKALILKFLLMVIFADVARDKSEFLIHILSLTVVLIVNLMILEVIVCKFDIWFGNTFHIGSQTVEVSMITKLKPKRIDSLFLFNIVHCSFLLTLLTTGHDELQVIIILHSASRIKSATDGIAVTLRSLISSSSTYLFKLQRLYLRLHSLTLIVFNAYKLLKALFDAFVLNCPWDLFPHRISHLMLLRGNYLAREFGDICLQLQVYDASTCATASSRGRAAVVVPWLNLLLLLFARH